MYLSIIVPCYNEVDNVDKLANEFFPDRGGIGRWCCRTAM